MGFLPMRDMRLPDVGDDLAADARCARLGPVITPWEVDRSWCPCRPGPSGCAWRLRTPWPGRDTAMPEITEVRFSVYLSCTRNRRPRSVTSAPRFEALDVALLLQDPRHLALEPWRDLDRLVRGDDPVADAGQEVGDRIGHGHGDLPARLRHAGDLALVASSRRQMRQRPNCGTRRAGGRSGDSACGRAS